MPQPTRKIHANANDVAVLVMSCDKYSDLWTPMLDNLSRFWPDRPYPVYLLCNHLCPSSPGLIPLAVGTDISWSHSMLSALARIKESFVLLWLDDLFLFDYVPTQRIEELASWARERNADYLRLTPDPQPEDGITSSVGQIREGALYRISTVLSLWRKEYLEDMLVPGESPWAFELAGSERSDSNPSCYAIYEPCFDWALGVRKGKWDPFVLERLQKIGTPVLQTERPVIAGVDLLLYRLLLLRSALRPCVPTLWQRALRKRLVQATAVAAAAGGRSC